MRVKKLQVLIINKNLRKYLVSRNGNEILVWSWNNPISVIDSYYILLTIKIFPPLIKGGFLLINTCLFKNHHKCYPLSFDHRTPRFAFFIQSLNFYICSPSENLSWDSFLLWQSLSLHPLQHGSNLFLQLLVLFPCHKWLLIISLLY